ncbi:MAG TPA: hypothetical protein VIK59_02980 [Verrucomicrobiae bacterium]
MILEAISRARLQRLEQFRVVAGTLQTGLISPGMAEWILGVSRQRVYAMISSARLETRAIAGHRLILLSSLASYCRRK